MWKSTTYFKPSTKLLTKSISSNVMSADMPRIGIPNITRNVEHNYTQIQLLTCVYNVYAAIMFLCVK